MLLLKLHSAMVLKNTTHKFVYNDVGILVGNVDCEEMYCNFLTFMKYVRHCEPYCMKRPQ